MLAEVPSLPAIATGVIHPDAPSAGELFVQGRVPGGLFDDVHGVGWRLITIDQSPCALDDVVCRWFEGIGGRIVRLDAETDRNGTYERWFTKHDVTWALQRPDFHLYGAAASAGAAAMLVSDLNAVLTCELKPTEGVRL
jgi:flavoprotein hydroxylase